MENRGREMGEREREREREGERRRERDCQVIELVHLTVSFLFC